MLDRLSLVVPRLAVGAEGADDAATSALADIRVGVNIIGLQHDAIHLPEQLRRAVRPMLDAIAAHYRRRSLDQADAALLGDIDRAIATAVQDPATMTRELLLQLSGIRRGLFPNAPPYVRETTLIELKAWRANMIGEMDVYGVFFPPLLVWVAARSH